MKRRNLYFSGLMILVFLLGFACIEEPGDKLPTQNPEIIDTVSFQDDIMPIFQTHCISCHGDFYPDGEFDLTTYEALMSTGNHAPNVVPFQPDSSWLVFVISPEDTTFHDRSPYDSITVVNPIREWILQGALDN